MNERAPPKGGARFSWAGCRRNRRPALCGRVLLLAALTLLPGPVPADTPEPASTGEEPGAGRFLDWPHDRLSRILQGAARGADALFSGTRNYDAPNATYVMLGVVGTSFRPGDGDDLARPLTRIRLNLPDTEDRLQLLVDRGVATLTRSEAQRDAEVAAGQAARDDTTFAALRVLVVDVLRLRVSTDVGARFRVPVSPFVRVRADRATVLGSWKVLLSQTFLDSTHDGFQSTSQASFQRPLAEHVTLSLLTDATWRQPRHPFTWSESAGVLWQIDDRTLAGAEAGLIAVSGADAGITATTLSVRWRRRLHRDWLILEARPQLIYPRDRGFQPIASLTVQVEVYFGEGYPR